MLDKLPQYIKHPYVQQFRDIRAVGLALFLVIVLLISWSGVKAIQTNYVLQKRIAQLEQENGVHRLQNTNLRLQNDYYNTKQYLDLAARQSFGLGAPGEKLLLVPRETALKHTTKTASVIGVARKASAKQPFYQRNFEAWMSFFLRRATPED